jgi:peptidoglycan/xylan/chitin deacetylase (PgdA/CDA1 family)
VIALGLVVFLVLPAAALVWLGAILYLEYRRDRVPILVYHRLARKADAETGGLADREHVWVSWDTAFADQMEQLRSGGFTTLDLDDYLRIRAGEDVLPARPVIISFDDGYRSNYTLAFPVLRRNAQKATVFVALDPDDHTRAQVAGLDDFLRPAELREMADSGISIQSHSLTHRILTELSDQEVRFELEESRRRLEEITGRPVRHLAIPRAGYSRRVRRIAREVGYSTVCCNNKGTANGLSDLLALPRIVVDREVGHEEFAQALRPIGGAMLRVVGNLKRIPERIGGARFARRVRDLLYRGPLRHAFTTRNLKRALAIAALAYLCGGVIFALRLLGA